MRIQRTGGIPGAVPLATHSVAFWDNRCLQHQALWDYYPQTRSGRRVTIKGDRPF